MTARLSHTDQRTNVGLDLPELSSVIPHEGLDHVKQVEIRWKCTTIDMPTDMAEDLFKRLDNVLHHAA